MERRWSRLLSGALSLVVLASLVSLAAPRPGAAEARTTFDVVASSTDFSSVELPYDLGQAEVQVYVPETGHALRGYMLDYWRANGAASVYGYPISESFASKDGHYSQAFERGIFQYHPELVWTDAPSVGLMPIGAIALKSRLDDVRRDGRRANGGADRRPKTWTVVDPNSSVVERAIRRGGRYIEATGHTMAAEFVTWYDSHEGWAYLGNPISEPAIERGVMAQYFDGALLLRNEDGDVWPAPLPRELADVLGIDTRPVERNGLPLFDETSLWTSQNPNPLGGGDAPGRKWIEVNISQQVLTAYQGDTVITQTYVSTGLAPNETELGLFHVRYKLPKTDMAGTTGPNGEVIALGEEAATSGDGSGYTVKDVPDVMYLNADAEALHGAYWHNNFGNRMSHGCINLPLNFAHFLYGWAPLGTMVWVHE